VASVNDAVLHRTWGEQTQLNFYSCNWMHRLSPADGACADFAQSDATNFALFDELLQGLHCGFDWSDEVESLYRISKTLSTLLPTDLAKMNTSIALDPPRALSA
jgi:hypothetical protein